MAETFVTSGAMITCSFGVAPCPLMASPSRKVFLSNMPKLNISDFAPGTNISSFGMCSSPMNPAVISATAAAMGVPTPAPCVPAITTPWMPGKADVLVENMPALTNNCHNMCMWGGQISFTNNGQVPIPPPIIIPPIGDPTKVPSGERAPLTDEETAQLSPSDQQQYQQDVSRAEKAGANEKKMSEAWKKTSDDYTKQGEPEKAALAKHKSQEALAASVDKSNVAVGDVNQQYRERITK